MLQPKDPRNDALIVNVNGRLVPRDEAAISPFDSSVQGGETRYTVLWVANQPVP